MIKFFTLFLIFTVGLFASTAYDEAYSFYKEGKYNKSLNMFETLVKEDKDSDAAYILGYMYEHGEGCKIDLEKSQKYYKTSAEGYYLQSKSNPNSATQKEQKKIYDSISKADDQETRDTVEQYAQSLYNIKAHHANYFLPVSYRLDSGTYANTGEHKARNIETEFQVSIKYNITANLLGLNEIYTFAYTQHSFWQLYEKSAYFRESNYNPEAFVTLPISKSDDAFLKAVKLGFAHQSNGRGGDDERSWNYFYAAGYFQYKHIFAELKLWSSWDSALEYNPDLLDYIGYGHIKFTLPYKKHLAQLKLRAALTGKGAVELNYSYPLFGRDDLFLYVKGFSGYGESLIDYKNDVQKMSIGFSISR